MSRTIVLIAATVGITLSATPADAQTNLQPGKYLVTMEMAGIGDAMPPIKVESCVTAEELAKVETLLIKGAPEEGCTVSNLKFQADRASFTMTCTNDGERYESNADLRFAADSYSGVVTTKTGNQVVTTKVAGKRLGPCDKK
jgi:hypothetical protein